MASEVEVLCQDVMTPIVFECHEDEAAIECARIMKDHNIGFVPIVDRDNTVVGVVTDRDLALRVLAQGKSTRTPLGQIMTKDVRVCHPSDSLRSAEEHMMATQKSRLVVVDETGRLVGIVSLSDVAQVENGLRTGRVLRAVTQREAAVHEPRTPAV